MASKANIVNTRTGQTGYQVPGGAVPAGWSAIGGGGPAPASTNPHDLPTYNPATDPMSSAYNPNYQPHITSPSQATPAMASVSSISSGIAPPVPPQTATVVGNTVQPVGTTTTTPPPSPTPATNTQPSQDLGAINNQLKQKYTGFTQAQGSAQPPATGAAARSAIDSYTQQLPTEQQIQDPMTGAVNTAFSEYLNNVNTLNSYESNTASVDHYRMVAQEAFQVPELQTSLMNIQNVMDGSENDIRNEISSAGGTATESQVEAMTYTRNKVLGLKAANIQRALTLAQGQLDLSVAAYQGDHQAALGALQDRVSSSANTLSMLQSMQKNTKDNYDKIVSNVGYTGLAATLDPASKSIAESALMLPQGTLSDPKSLSALETYREKSLGLSQQRVNITVANQQMAQGNAASLAQQLVDGQIAPSQLSKRSTGPNSYANVISLANMLSQQQKGTPFNTEKADQQFNFGNSQTVQQTQVGLGFAVSTLKTLKVLSAKLPNRGDITFGNKTGQWLEYNGSDQDTVNFVTKANIAIDDIGAALGGGVSTDAKLGIAKNLVDPTLNDQAFQGQMNTDISSVQQRANEYAQKSGQTVSVGGVIYPVGQTISDGSQSFTVNTDGTLMDSAGTIYSVDDNGDINQIQ